MFRARYTLAHCDVALARTVDSRTKLEFLEVRLTERIVRACVEHYYSMLESQPAELVSLYLEDSTCTVVNDGTKHSTRRTQLLLNIHLSNSAKCGCIRASGWRLFRVWQWLLLTGLYL